MADDIFADIAAGGIGGRREELISPEPLPRPEKYINLEDTNYKPQKTIPKMSSSEELSRELESKKEEYKEFLRDFAPSLPDVRKRIDLVKFILNDEREITIPHYGGPIGNATQIYKTGFCVEEISADEAIFICFKGADYKTTVYINDVCVGQHEGFFSPFEFDITEYVIKGENKLKVYLENDYIYMGNTSAGKKRTEGDKLYAATGPGYDDPDSGWHHCPPGMGIYNDVYLEFRKRLHIRDVYARPLVDEGCVEIWTEVYNCDYEEQEIELNISIYGQNFKDTVIENYIYRPVSIKTVGVGDSLTEARVKADGELNSPIPLVIKKGSNLIKCRVPIEDIKLWTLETPYLYQVQVRLDGDCYRRQFGMRSFTQDVKSSPKGMFYLNGKKIRLRGANTMGFEQQDVISQDIDQLIEDILLAKIANMNFWRLTQRPVQEEVYEYCDKLGLMTQTDLPLFGCMRRSKFCEGVRQAEEMERLIRGHPCNVIISYINEPFPNANNEPHRHLERTELEQFFAACDSVIRLNNPERVIKHIDGDYDPPDETLPDNHCYPMWYNGHGIDIGRLHKGYWLAVKPDWYYGCGEYGAEGFDYAEIMKEYYPEEWLREPFSPNNIVGAQTGNFHYFFYDTQDNIGDWVKESQKHQAFSTKLMTEAFRRDPGMVSFAIHLFIDAWPSGWMKAVMDFKRNPKPAFFSYKNALESVMISLRTDKFKYFDDEKIKIESWLCNDTDREIKGEIIYELYQGDKFIKRGAESVTCNSNDVSFNGFVTFNPPEVKSRQTFKLKAVLSKTVYKEFEFEVFPQFEITFNDNVITAGDDLSKLELAREGKTVILEGLAPGEYSILDRTIIVKPCGMLPVHFVSRDTGHELIKEFGPDDFKMWYDQDADMITPILASTFTGERLIPILTSGNMDKRGNWNTAFAAAEIPCGDGRVILCQLDLTRRLDNPIAKLFYQKLLL